MQSSLAEKQDVAPDPDIPPVPLKTYQWEEVKRAKLQGGYPWTHLQKEPLEGEEITAETILRDTSPRMSRDNSRERSSGKSPDLLCEDGPQKILNLDSSPGSSRKLGEGDEEIIHVPNFSKEISLDSEEDILENKGNVNVQAIKPDALVVNNETKITASPKGILKRKLPEKNRPVSGDSPRNSKCCHPFVEKIKHIADKTIHKSDKHSQKKGIQKKKMFIDKQEIIILDNSPGSERRDRMKASSESEEVTPTKKISLVMETDVLDKPKDGDSFEIEILDSSPSSKKRREHVYEDIESNNKISKDDSIEQPCNEILESNTCDNQSETKSGDSKDPSLFFDEPMDDEDISEKIDNIKSMYDTSMTPDKLIPDIKNDEVIITEPIEDASQQNDDDVTQSKAEMQRESPNITITEVTEDGLTDRHLNLDDMDICAQDRRVHFDVSDSNNKPDSEELSAPEEGSDNLWSKTSDHEYEPVGKPPVETRETVNPEAMNISVVESAGETPHTTKGDEDPEWMGDDASSTTSHERQFLHPANEEDVDAFGAIENEDDAHHVALQLQKELEDRYFVNTPTTTESRTDCEISTSQVDSSAIENLPLKRENRKKNTVALETAKLRQRISSQTGKIKTHAGKIKTKLKTIKKPQFNLPERPKFNLPERPKFNLPDRPKFNLPERPKFNLPERPKFNLPERPKFNLPERPKFNLPERPKFKMPERPKINFPERPKISFPDKAKFSLPDRSKFKLPDRPKLNFSGFNRSKENRSSVDDTTTTEPSVSSKKNFLDFDFRTYPRIFSKNKKKRESSGERPGTPPPGFATVPRATKDRKEIVASHWEHASSRTTDDEPRHYGIEYSYDKEPDFQTKLAQVDKDYREMQQEAGETEISDENLTRATLENKEIWNAIERNTVQQMEHRSSLPQLSSENENGEKYDDDESSAASTGQHRRGVLEEINNDEFFLRQKGISQDNIEVGKYLSNEIRDAFRSPINALNQIDQDNNFNSNILPMDTEDNGFETRYKVDSEEQLSPEDDINQNNLMSENDDGYYTFPPVRPSRAKKLKTLVQELPKEKIAIAHDESIEDFANIHLESVPTPNIFSDIPKNIEQESNLENFQKRIFGSSFKEPEILENLNEYENEMEQTKEVPTIPKRRKRNPADIHYSESESFINENIDSQNWTEQKFMSKSIDMDEQVPVYRVEPVMQAHNEGTPVIPRRSRSRGSRTTSVGDDDRTSRGAESLILDSHIQMNNDDLDYMDDLDDGPGYAIVDKTVSPKEDMPPPRPPPPMRKHRSAKSLSGDRQFFTVPRSLKESSPPKRPTRNYSTLGPSRPPRKKSTTSLTGLDSLQKTSSSGDVTQYVEIEDDDVDSQKNLKSGDVVSKMKDRPLPPPPRPPRGPKKRKDDFDIDNDKDIDDTVKIENDMSSDPTITNETNRVESSIADNNNNIEFPDANVPAFATSKEENLPYEITDQEQVIEIEVSTQTDPLPDDFDYDLGIDEPLSESFDMKELSYDLTKEEAEENSIDVEIMSKGLQKFRESSRPSSRSSKLKSPTDRPKTPLGRMSPTAILVERRVSSPTRINQHEEIVTQASLTVQPIDEPEILESEVIPEHRFYPTAFEILHSTNVPQTLLDHSEQQSEIKRHDEKNEIVVEPSTIDQIISQDVIPLTEQQQSPLPVDEPKNDEYLQSPDLSHIAYQSQSVPLHIEESLVEKLQPSISQVENIQPAPQDSSHATHQTQSVPINVEEPVVEESQSFILNTISQVDDQQKKQPNLSEMEVLKTQKLQVADLDVERLSVSELQASKILVSEIEGLTLQVNDVNSKSGHIYVRGFELAPSVIEDLLEKFAQMIPTTTTAPQETTSQDKVPQTKVEVHTNETQTDDFSVPSTSSAAQVGTSTSQNDYDIPLQEDISEPPPRPPPPPTMHSSMFQPIPCYSDLSMPSPSYYRYRRPIDRRQDNLPDDEHPPPARRKHRREHTISSSEDEDYKPVSRRVPASSRPAESSELSVSDLSIQLFRACQNSVSRTLQHIISFIRKHFGEVQSKKEVEMAVVIFLVMAAGLIILSINDGRAIHHHHWDFINPPDSKN